MSRPSTSGDVIYEVRLSVEASLAATFRDWLDGHIAEIIGLPGFRGARLFREDSDDAQAIFTVHYQLRSRAALAEYLRDHAPRLRADGLARFGEAFSASRRVLHAIADYPCALAREPPQGF